MDFELSEERRMLAETVGRVLRERVPAPPRRGEPDALWDALAGLGLVAALVPPEAGGLGGSGEDILVVFEAVGRTHAPGPFLATLLGAAAVAAAGDARQRAALDAVAAGRARIAFAHGEADGRYAPAWVVTRAEAGPEGWRLTGAKTVVIDGDRAERLVVTARVAGATGDEAGLGLFLVAGDAPGLARRAYGTVEGGRAAELTLADTPAEALGVPGAAFPAIEATLAHGAVAVAAEALGLMETCKAATLDHLRTRRQFGRPIGSFQALQHRMVDMALEIEQARSATMLAAGMLGAERALRERAAAAAKHLAGRVGRLVAEEAIQLHGGIAMTWEHPLGHFAKRLVMLDHLLGDTDHHLARFVALSRGGA